ncbi:MAG: pheromone shutdown protein TraB [Candidatus Nanohaloarchaea archaeon]|jgi:pheromone shutdown protein TraB
MIELYGTSHVSQESIDKIDKVLEDDRFEIVALELDSQRLHALQQQGQTDSSGAPIFLRLLRYFQRYIGRRTGVMPGEEMIHAYNKAMETNRDVALIDQDIRVTFHRLSSLSRKEKVKAGFSMVGGLIFGEKFDVSKIPEEEMIDEMTEQLEESFPGLHQVLIEERNEYMYNALKQLQENNPEKDIAAFVGAGHRKALEEMLNESDRQSSLEEHK